MSGGVAYVLDETGDFPGVATRRWSRSKNWKTRTEIEEIRLMIHRHGQYTRSQRAFKVLALWEEMTPKFVKVMPDGLQAHAAIHRNAWNKPA